jgi:hypothetical protein
VLLNVKAFAMGMVPAAAKTTTASADTFCPTNVKQRETQMNTELMQMDLLDESLTPVWISLFLSVEIPDAAVDHGYADGNHRFCVVGDEFAYEVSLEQSVLTKMDAEELMYALELVVDRILAGAGPRRITVRGPARYHAHAA